MRPDLRGGGGVGPDEKGGERGSFRVPVGGMAKGILDKARTSDEFVDVDVAVPEDMDIGLQALDLAIEIGAAHDVSKCDEAGEEVLEPRNEVRKANEFSVGTMLVDPVKCATVQGGEEVGYAVVERGGTPGPLAGGVKALEGAGVRRAIAAVPGEEGDDEEVIANKRRAGVDAKRVAQLEDTEQFVD
mmetsp:Transcript_4902/g.14852  ORF Transcript_4902/g.14852 Transcript_4902/m.14852 type:complete len:187 (+) Transcript_4902:20-580(+)